MNFEQFVIESNRIEGILRPPTTEEVKATKAFVTGPTPTVESVSALASVYTRGYGVLRDKAGLDVRVGNHFPPKGGPHIVATLEGLLETIEDGDCYGFHLFYETLHPFLDGNGRTGRALWAWQMWRENQGLLDLGFLHAWYYQTLGASRKTQRTNTSASDGAIKPDTAESSLPA